MTVPVLSGQRHNRFDFASAVIEENVSLLRPHNNAFIARSVINLRPMNRTIIVGRLMRGLEI